MTEEDALDLIHQFLESLEGLMADPVGRSVWTKVLKRTPLRRVMTKLMRVGLRRART